MMLRFFITKARISGVLGEGFPEPPVCLNQYGAITDEEAIEKTGRCSVNGINLDPNQRVIVKGTVHPSLLPWARVKQISVVLDWDGCDLTVFPEYKKADFEIDLDQSNLVVCATENLRIESHRLHWTKEQPDIKKGQLVCRESDARITPDGSYQVVWAGEKLLGNKAHFKLASFNASDS